MLLKNSVGRQVLLTLPELEGALPEPFGGMGKRRYCRPRFL